MRALPNGPNCRRSTAFRASFISSAEDSGTVSCNISLDAKLMIVWSAGSVTWIEFPLASTERNAFAGTRTVKNTFRSDLAGEHSTCSRLLDDLILTSSDRICAARTSALTRTSLLSQAMIETRDASEMAIRGLFEVGKLHSVCGVCWLRAGGLFSRMLATDSRQQITGR